MSGMPTLLTTKLILRGAITALDMPALRTHLRSMLGVDDLKQDACLLSFVGYKLAKLVKSPRPHAVTLRLAKPYPVAYALQILKGYAAPGAFGLRNESLGNRVIGVTTKPSLAVADAFELLTNALTLSGISRQVRRRLQGLLVCPVLDAHRLYVVAGVFFPIRVRSQVDNAEIDAEEVIGITRRLGLMLDGGHEEELAILASHQLGKQLDVAKLHGLIVAHHHRDVVANPIRGLDIELLQALVAERTLTIGDSRQRTKGYLLALVPLVAGGDLSKRLDCNIRWQIKRLAHFVVIQLMQRIPIGKLTFKRPFSYPITRGIEAAHRLFECVGLLWRRKELDLYNPFHNSRYNHYLSIRQGVLLAFAQGAQGPVAQATPIPLNG